MATSRTRRQALSVLASLAIAPVFAGSAGAQSSNRLPEYVPDPHVHGVIRNFGSALAGLVQLWENEFVKLQPGVSFKNTFAGSDAAISGLATKEFDLAPNGREAQFIEYLSFFEVYGHNPFEVTVGTGSYDVPGRTWAEVIFVNKDNPLTQLTMQQLDGIFGEARTGSVKGFLMTSEGARGPEKNIRTWGQLGLKGEWANKPIQTYGYAPTGMSNFFQLKVMHGNDKWNPNLREYAETNTKMVDPKLSAGLGSRDMLIDLSHDKFGIGWSGIGQAKGIPGLKILALAEKPGGAYVYPTYDTVYNRTYPLTRSVFIYLNHQKGEPLDPKLKAFLMFVLSRQGQDIVARHHEYIPLNAEAVVEQRQRLAQ